MRRQATYPARRPPRPAGLAFVDLVVGLAIISAVLMTVTFAQQDSARFHRVLLARQRCVLAAEAQLDSLAATGERIEPNDFEPAFAPIAVEVQTRPGQGPWAGLTRVQAVARQTVEGRQVQARLVRYLPPRKVRP